MFWWVPFGKVPAVSAQQLDTMRKDGSQAAQLIDVRSGDEWRAGHIADAINVPVTQLSAPRIRRTPTAANQTATARALQ
jgi:rhodanese-related sulfurtransferase